MDGEFNGPSGIAAYDVGIYVADTFHNRIQEFTPTGTFLRKWGAGGSLNGEFFYPFGVGGSLWVADTYNNRIQQFGPDGTWFRTITTASSGADFLSHPTAVREAGNIYVVDSDKNRVVYYASSGTYLGQWGTAGSGNGEFSSPAALAIRYQNFYVTDELNHRIQRFSAPGVYAGQWGGFGAGNGQFNQPRGITTGKVFDEVFVADSLNDRIQVFSADGTYLGQFGTAGAGNGEFDNPLGVEVDGTQRVYVSDTGNNRVQYFSCPLPPHKRAFVTSIMYDGNLGGLTGADAKCAARAQAAGLGSNFKAWLSDSVTSAASRLNHSTVPYVAYNGTSPFIVADDWADLADGSISSIFYDEFGNPPSPTGFYFVWTGTDTDGSSEPAAGSSSFCSDWMLSSSGQTGVMGFCDQGGSPWTNYGTLATCDQAVGRLYCLEQ